MYMLNIRLVKEDKPFSITCERNALFTVLMFLEKSENVLEYILIDEAGLYERNPFFETKKLVTKFNW